MASYERCLAEITQAVGRELTVDEATRLDKQVTKLVDKLGRQKNLEAFDTLLMREIEAQANLAEAAAVLQKRNAVKNLVAFIKHRDSLWANWSDDLAEGLQAKLGGSMTGREGAKRSTALKQDTLADTYQAGWVADLDKHGVTKALASGEYDLQIWQAIWEQGKDTPDAAKLAALPKEAVTLASLITKWNEVARINANKAGAWIQPLPGYVVKQSHDAPKIKEQDGKPWMDFMAEHLDWEKTFPDVEPAKQGEVLKDLYYNLSTNTHVKFNDAPTMGLNGHANIGRKLSHERSLHFKDAESEHAYNVQFGRSSLREAMFYGLGKMGRDTALMQDWGPNARQTYLQLVTDTQQRMKQQQNPQMEAFNARNRYLERVLWPFIDGSINAVEHATFARYSGMVRHVEMMADLGGSVLSSVTDLPVYASAGAQQGQNFLSGIADAVSGLFSGVSHGERLQVISEAGVMLDGLRDNSANRWDGGLISTTSKLINTYFKLNLLGPWTDRLRGNFVLSTAHRLANHSHLPFKELPDGMRHLLRQYDIGDAEWSLIRQAKESHADGRAFLTAEGMGDIPDAAFGTYAERQGQANTPYFQQAARTELQSRLRAFFQDQATTAVVQPDTMTKAMLTGGTHAGTAAGEAARHFWMYKSFTMSIMRRVLGRELFGYGETRGSIHGALWEMVKDPTGSPFVGMTKLIALSTVFGYAAMSLKDLAKGREPRVPDNGAEFAKVLAAAAAQGGGFGIYGDFLFGEMKSRYGSGALDTLMGPTFSRANKMMDLVDALKHGDDPSAKAFALAMNSAPFVNLFYTRWAMDYLVLYQLQEMMNPGYLRRMENRLKQEKDQQYILPPSSVVGR